jgi:hypothetical protein
LGSWLFVVQRDQQAPPCPKAALAAERLDFAVAVSA